MTDITTIKLSKETKGRLDKLKVYSSETYEEILQEMLGILSLCRLNPEAAKGRLISIDRMVRKTKKIYNAPEKKEEIRLKKIVQRG